MYCDVVKIILILSVLSGTLLTSGEDLNEEVPSNLGGQGERVFGGTPVNPPYSHPYIVQIEDFYYKNKTISGGVIIDRWTILTLRVGVKDYKTIFAGKHFIEGSEESQQKRNVCAHSAHPYKADNHFDYGLLHLSVPLDFNKYVKAAALPEFNVDYPKTNCKLLGWGLNKTGTSLDLPKELLEAPVDILDSAKCPQKHPTLLCLSKGPWYHDRGTVVSCPSKSGVNVVVGLVAHTNKLCQEGVAAATYKLDPHWVRREIKQKAKKCRPKGPDCCNNAGKINGDPAIPHSRPYVVQIHHKGTKEVTTGVLLNAYTILTSAHKLKDILKIIAGKHLFGKYESTQQIRRPCHISKHPKFDKPKHANGYGLIHLSDPFVLDEFVNAIRIAPTGDLPKDNCSIIGWQGNSSATVLREQLVQFDHPKTCENVDATITCVETGACLHDWGSPVICSHDAMIFLHAITSSAAAYCEDGMLASIAELPRDWIATELKKAETTCGKSTY